MSQEMNLRASTRKFLRVTRRYPESFRFLGLWVLDPRMHFKMPTGWATILEIQEMDVPSLRLGDLFTVHGQPVSITILIINDLLLVVR